MADTANRFVWYDLMTPDLPAAEKFYTNVIGWTSSDAGIPDRPPYTLLHAGGSMVAGVMGMSPEAGQHGAKPGWLGHIGVPDVDAYASKVKDAGGRIHRDPQDIPGIGRFAVAADPQGAVFVLFQGSGTPPPEPAPGTPGHIGWHELHAGDGASAWEFYADAFGWTKADDMDMGPAGTYRMFSTGGAPVGGIMTKAAEIPAPFWLYYFNVDGVDAAVERTKAGGGTLNMGPHQIPGGGWIAICTDPQGAVFSMVGMAR